MSNLNTTILTILTIKHIRIFKDPFRETPLIKINLLINNRNKILKLKPLLLIKMKLFEDLLISNNNNKILLKNKSKKITAF
jgi:hypothetical protein